MDLGKKFLWMIVVWFALLQVASPFIHAHIKGDSPTQGHGLHMHGLMSSTTTTPTLQAVHDEVQTIGVDKGLTKQPDLLPPPVLAVLFIALLLLPLFQIAQFRAIKFSDLFHFTRSASRPRAPPSFL
ncbi:MAG: hypothetical protein CVU29_00805 [Betaproteobacteria bacterium HGW-Betaproteobacteria-22]|nr:MAG: hypothetical protein CVU29_00805 [Betaproteobacteria bacterium HGW-Betaproteobacteria-22]